MKAILKNFAMVDIPLLIFMGQILVEMFVPIADKPAFHSEGGPHEFVQAVFIGLAALLAVYLTIRVRGKWLKLWTGIAALAAIYILGEEISWGQWIFHWQTPEQWAAINDQNETNLHNTSSWLDQKPRIVLETGVLVGGLIIPALRRFRPEKLPARFRDIYPDNIVVFTAVFALLTKILTVTGDAIGHKIFWRGSEVMELYLYYFVLLYLCGRYAAWRDAGQLTR